MELTHKGYECEVVFDLYADNKNIAILFLGKEGTNYEAELISVATVNTDHVTDSHIVGIKTWSENEGIVKSLVDGNVIKNELLYTIPTGFVQVEYYQLTDEALNKVTRLKEKIS